MLRRCGPAARAILDDQLAEVPRHKFSHALTCQPMFLFQLSWKLLRLHRGIHPVCERVAAWDRFGGVANQMQCGGM